MLTYRDGLNACLFINTNQVNALFVQFFGLVIQLANRSYLFVKPGFIFHFMI